MRALTLIDCTTHFAFGANLLVEGSEDTFDFNVGYSVERGLQILQK